MFVGYPRDTWSRTRSHELLVPSAKESFLTTFRWMTVKIFRTDLVSSKFIQDITKYSNFWNHEMDNPIYEIYSHKLIENCWLQKLNQRRNPQRTLSLCLYNHTIIDCTIQENNLTAFQHFTIEKISIYQQHTLSLHYWFLLSNRLSKDFCWLLVCTRW